ncbi:hypothetical protein [Tsuneonella mangrovi]|uniref:hypothetical protein n=1 Tax=Tsuneonella mangrovi TaxID=1982042 RepID=UPI0012378EC8|nr:hypothetical protein [Tsuneonella mangrovi]
MATAAPAGFEPVHESQSSENSFFGKMAIFMAIVVVAGFMFQLAMGRSTFASPPRVHFHAISFMGWVALFVTQSNLAARGNLRLHRKLGWVAAGWIMLMLTSASIVIVAMVRNATVPFFFYPQQFLVSDPMILITFAGLVGWAIAWRKRHDWHPRLQICAMAVLAAPAFGRLLPMPLIAPYSFEASCLACLIFPAIGMVRDRRRYGKIHPAWVWGTAILLTNIVVSDMIAYSPIGAELYHTVAAGTAGAGVDPLGFGTPPGGG